MMRPVSLKFSTISSSLVLMLITGGCELVPRTDEPPTTRSEPAPVPAPVRETPEPEREVDRLFREARLAFDDNRLTTPVDDNAYYRYLRILTLDPGNEKAEEGIANIVEKYLKWSMDKAEQGQFRAAITWLNKARSVDHTHPNIEAVETFIDEQRSSSQMTYRLSAAAVDQKAPRVIQELHEIGREIAQQNARVIIVGRSDAEGRWIYQQLNDASPDRVRAEFKPGGKPLVRLIY